MNPSSNNIKYPLFSIVIPVKNGSSTIKECLNAIYTQTLIKQTEVIVIDSGSTDSTLDILKNFPVHVYQIPPQEFNHGATRNYGVSLAKGEIIVMTVQDAVPSDKHWLERLINPFNDHDIMGVCGRQMVPHDIDKNPGVWSLTYSEPKLNKVSFTKIELDNICPIEKKNRCGWDNVTAAYRKSALLSIPFPKTNYSEDIHWAYLMYQKEYTLAYSPDATVWHYHHETINYRFRRHFIEITNHFQLYNLKTFPILKKSDFIPLYQTHKKAKSQKLKWFIYNLRLLFANKMAESYFILNYLLGGQKKLTKKYFKLTKEIPIGQAK